jgi:hypothetical protein
LVFLLKFISKSYPFARFESIKGYKMSRNNRLEIMTAQKEIIEKKKMEIAMRKDLAILTSDILKSQSATTDTTDSTSNAKKVAMFKNDGSFLEQFKILKELAEAKAKNKTETAAPPNTETASDDPKVRYRHSFKNFNAMAFCSHRQKGREPLSIFFLCSFYC